MFVFVFLVVVVLIVVVKVVLSLLSCLHCSLLLFLLMLSSLSPPARREKLLVDVSAPPVDFSDIVIYVQQKVLWRWR